MDKHAGSVTKSKAAMNSDNAMLWQYGAHKSIQAVDFNKGTLALSQIREHLFRELHLYTYKES